MHIYLATWQASFGVADASTVSLIEKLATRHSIQLDVKGDGEVHSRPRHSIQLDVKGEDEVRSRSRRSIQLDVNGEDEVRSRSRHSIQLEIKGEEEVRSRYVLERISIVVQELPEHDRANAASLD